MALEGVGKQQQEVQDTSRLCNILEALASAYPACGECQALVE
jgi:hypothetical protein